MLPFVKHVSISNSFIYLLKLVVATCYCPECRAALRR